jgi:hypothetical protein
VNYGEQRLKPVEVNAPQAPIDSITEVTAPVIGVKILVRALQHELYEFELLVLDLDSGLAFKTIKSNDLSDLLDRQHKLLLGFAT